MKMGYKQSLRGKRTKSFYKIVSLWDALWKCLLSSEPEISTGFSIHKPVLKHPVSTEVHTY